MLHWNDTTPHVDVSDGEYLRLLGYPRGHELNDRAEELMRWSRSWYAEHGHPWASARVVDVCVRQDDAVEMEGDRFESTRLARRLRGADSHLAVLAAVSAGDELESEARRAWENGVPDQYFFLECFGSAVVEQLMASVHNDLCSWAENQSMALLQHESPGYRRWNVAEQVRLLSLAQRAADLQSPVHRLSVLDSGMLKPKKSQLAVFGLTARVGYSHARIDKTSCGSCGLVDCTFRRPTNTQNHPMKQIRSSS